MSDSPGDLVPVFHLKGPQKRAWPEKRVPGKWCRAADRSADGEGGYKGLLMDPKITQHGIAGTKDRIKRICAGNWQAIMIQEEMIMPVGIA